MMRSKIDLEAFPRLSTSTTGDGHTALTTCAEAGPAQCVATLLTLGADRLTTNVDGETALFVARRYHHQECVALLLDANTRGDPGSLPTQTRR